MRRTKYTPMKGADFTNEPALVDNDRAPICENIIPDGTGYPEKRPGFRTLKEYEGKIYGLHKYTFGGVTKMLVHEGNRLWIDDTLLCEDMAESVSRSYQNEDDLIILDGENYRVFKDNTGVAYGVPWVTKKDKTVTLDYHGAESVERVGIVYVGTTYYDNDNYEDILKKGSSYTDINGESGIIEYLNPADGQTFELPTNGWFIVVTDSGKIRNIKQFYVAQPQSITAGVPYFELLGNKAVLKNNNSDYLFLKVQWGYQENEKTKKISHVDTRPKGDSEYEMFLDGFYFFRITETNLSKERNTEHYLYYEEEKTKYKLFNMTADDTLHKIVSGKSYTDNGAYIPTTTISNTSMTETFIKNEAPYVAVANGVAYEKINKLTRYRRMTALGCGSTVKDASGSSWKGGRYMLDGTLASECIGKEIYYGGSISSGTRLGRYVHNMLIFVNEKKYDQVLSVTLDDMNSYQYEMRELGYNWVIVRCAIVNGKESASYLAYIGDDDLTPSVVGRDNIEIYYEAEMDEDNDLSKCTVISEYDNSLFVTGNPDKPNFDWHSYPENPYYYPDLSYQKFGDGTPVIGYVNTGEYQAVIKKDGAAGGSIYIRSVAELNGERAYPVKQMASGVGGVSKDGFCSLIGDDLILTKHGIFAFTNIDMTGEKTLSNRSWYVDGKLTKENLENAVMFVWQGKCFCAAGGNVYILNAEASMSRNHKYDTLYDCYYWTGIPIERALVVNDELFFSNGCKVCRLNTDLDEKERYNDDGAPIVARWGTKLDDDGDITRYKTMIKKGNTVTVKPFVRSSAKVYVRTENDVEREVKYGTADIFDWNDIDFNRFTFLTSKTLREIVVNSKVKKYKRLQFIVENDALNEGFGIIEINKHYAFGNFIKR